jgi:site-specific recombinase XerD
VTQLRKKVIEELDRRNYSQATAHAYVSAIRRFAEHFHRSPERLTSEHVREYQLHLIEQHELRPKSLQVQMCALRFLFLKVLKRRWSRDDLPLPRSSRRQLPTVLSREEVARLIDAAPNLRYRTILMGLYSTGMRRSELCHLRVEDIDSQRMVIHIRQGKGGKDRDVPLSPKLLEQLRTYYRSLKHKTAWVFPSLQARHRDEPMTDKAIWHACETTARRAGISKHIHPHTLRHSYATHLVESGAELPSVQILLGHADPRDTMIYVHLSTRQLRAAPNPLDTLESAGESAPEAGA